MSEKSPFSWSEYGADDTDTDDKEDDNKSKKSKKKSGQRHGGLVEREESESDSKNTRNAEKVSRLIEKSYLSGLFGEIDAKKDDTEATIQKAEDDTEAGQIISEAESSVTEQFVAVVDERIEDVKQELETVQPGIDKDEAKTDEAFLEGVDRKLEAGESPDRAIEDAASEIVYERKKNDQMETDVEIDTEESIEGSDSFIENEATINNEPDEENTDDPKVGAANSVGLGAASSSVALTSSSGIGSRNSRAAANNNQPTGVVGGGFMIPPSSAGGPSSGGGNVYTSPGLTSPNTFNNTNSPENIEVNSSRRRGDLLLGAFVGYLFGRRRGRIKTEERLEPEIAKRDEQIDALTSKLEETEVYVRSEAAKRHIAEQESVRLKEKATDEKISITQKESTSKFGVEQMITLDNSTEQIPNNEIEYSESFAYDKFPEIKPEKAIQPLEKPSPQNEQLRKQALNVRTMTLPKLLEVADKISYGDKSLKELYESKQLDPVNLRKVLIENQSGGNFERAMRDALNAVEMRHELRNEIKTYSHDFSSAGAVATSGVLNAVVSTDSTKNIQHETTSEKYMSDDAEERIRQEDLLEASSESKVERSLSITIGVMVGVAIALSILYFFSR